MLPFQIFCTDLCWGSLKNIFFWTIVFWNNWPLTSLYSCISYISVFWFLTVFTFFFKQDVPCLSFLFLPSSAFLTPGSSPDSCQTTLPVWLQSGVSFFLSFKKKKIMLWHTCTINAHALFHFLSLGNVTLKYINFLHLSQLSTRDYHRFYSKLSHKLHIFICFELGTNSSNARCWSS